MNRKADNEIIRSESSSTATLSRAKKQLITVDDRQQNYCESMSVAMKTLDDEGGRLECLTSSTSLNSEKQVPMLATARRPRRSRISWQNTSWSCSFDAGDHDLTASQNSTYQPLKYEDDDDDIEEILRETSGSLVETRAHTETKPQIEGFKRKSMQTRLKEDEEAFTKSLELLALETEKKDAKDSNQNLGEVL